MTSAGGELEPGEVPGEQAPRANHAVTISGRYGLLLLVLIVTYLLSAFISGPVFDAVQVVLFVGTLLLAIRNSGVSRLIARVIIGVVLIGSAAAFGIALAQPSREVVGASEIWTGLILLTSAVVIVRRVLSSDTVTMQSIYGALSAYMIIGLMFASFYAAISKVGGVPFFANGQPGDTRTYQYFSFTTLTTLGYGDFTAAGNAGRAIAVMEAMFGQVFLATLVARLVAAFQPGQRK